ncbi:hypothetical protein P4O66_001995 [Electrophorus voltai]|uniref:Uncharacterized protein n=1 Tax=Electrophorus voltai TaxID=2609070 RepID=A0AAD8ZV46_9TELE|nr:hypothetical protein P4O66_001995 [Electrophorus voltai]
MNAFARPVVWLTVFLTTCAAVLPSIVVRALGVLLVNSNRHKIQSFKETTELQSWFKRGAPRRRSSYAMSQGKGFGRLLTSGAGLHSTVPPLDGRKLTELASTTQTGMFCFGLLVHTFACGGVEIDAAQ